ncbi:PREDICTED: oocyte zinc finger protein XlCOF29-like [Nanorana parkeri]|uniref:oocyte zinc finger protein XlCOF29-like n=1 Tax=Nanorana parkeri TaxID=125878 RepID=UPI000854259E|nr:PREDICTED: oocyte zinc finger protein XlCOF29-like [Nanorana parkeri]
MTNGSALRMDKDQSHVTERILKLTLEIIYLLTGEDYTVVKRFKEEGTGSKNPSVSGGLSITECPPRSLISKRSNGKKILEVTNKIIKLLTEEWEYLEENKDIYNDVMMDEDQSLKETKKEEQESDESSDDGNVMQTLEKKMRLKVKKKTAWEIKLVTYLENARVPLKRACMSNLTMKKL